MQVLVRDPVDCASLHGLATRVRFGLTIGALLKAGSAVEWAWGNDWAIARALPNPSFYVFIASTTDDNAAAVHACCDAIAAIARAEGSQSVRFAAVDELVQPAIVAAMTQRLFAVGENRGCLALSLSPSLTAYYCSLLRRMGRIR